MLKKSCGGTDGSVCNAAAMCNNTMFELGTAYVPASIECMCVGGCYFNSHFCIIVSQPLRNDVQKASAHNCFWYTNSMLYTNKEFNEMEVYKEEKKQQHRQHPTISQRIITIISKQKQFFLVYA